MKTTLLHFGSSPPRLAYYYDTYFFDIAPPSWGTKAILWATFDALTPRQLQAVLLRFFDELSISEIAAELVCSKSTVTRLIDKGLKNARKAFADAGILTYAGLTRACAD